MLKVNKLTNLNTTNKLNKLKQTINFKTLITTKLTNLTKNTTYLALSLLISLTSILPILLPATANAAPSTPPDSCFDFNSGTQTIEDYYDYEGNNNSNPACTRELIIPDIIDGTSVTIIGSSAFESSQLTSVTIPNSVTSIGDSAFADNQLTSATIPNSVTTIDDGAFAMNNIISVNIPNSVTAMDDSFILNPLESVNYDGHTYLNTDPVTEDCYDFDSVTGTVDNYTDHHINITTMQTHNNACIGRVLNIPSTIGGVAVTTIGYNAFEFNQFTVVTIPDSVTTISANAFFGEQGIVGTITDLTLGNSVATIGDEAFAYNQLTSITIPNSVTTIGDDVFTSNHLSFATLPSSITAINPSWFRFQTIPDGMSYAELMLLGLGVTSQDYNDYINSVINVAIYTTDSTNPNNLTDVSAYTEADLGAPDINADGDTTDILNGGQLINPSRVTANFKDTEGNTIAPSTIATGTGLSSYLAVDNPTNDLGLYYKAGGSYTVPTAPTIAGYEIVTTPSNIASLSAGNNQINYVYKATSNNNNNSNIGSTANLTTPTSPISAFSLRPVSISTPTGTNISSSSTVPESSLVTQDPNNQYPLGLVNFSFTTNQSSNQVNLTFITDLTPNQVTPKKYNPSTNTYTNLPTSSNPTITETTINNQHALVLTYTLIDNGELDLDSAAGTISDPVGLAVSNSTYDQLANTGDNNIIIYLSLASSLIVIASWLTIATRKRKLEYFARI